MELKKSASNSGMNWRRQFSSNMSSRIQRLGSAARIRYHSSRIQDIYRRSFITAKRKTPTNRKSAPDNIATIHGTRRNTQSYVRGTNSLLINQYKAAGTKNPKATATDRKS